MSAPDASNPGPMEIEEEQQQPLAQPSVTSSSTEPGGADWNPPNAQGSSQPFTPPHITPARPPAPPPFQLPPPGGLPNQQQSAQPAHSAPNSTGALDVNGLLSLVGDFVTHKMADILRRGNTAPVLVHATSSPPPLQPSHTGASSGQQSVSSSHFETADDDLERQGNPKRKRKGKGVARSPPPLSRQGSHSSVSSHHTSASQESQDTRAPKLPPNLQLRRPQHAGGSAQEGFHPNSSALNQPETPRPNQTTHPGSGHGNFSLQAMMMDQWNQGMRELQRQNEEIRDAQAASEEMMREELEHLRVDMGLKKATTMLERRQKSKRSTAKANVLKASLGSSLRSDTTARASNTNRAGRPAAQAEDADISDGENDTSDERGAHNRFAALIRNEFDTLIKLTSWDVLYQKFPRLTDEELRKFEVGAPDAPVCTFNKYRVCFSRGWKTCSFNRHAAVVFQRLVLQKWKDGRYQGDRIPNEFFTREGIASCLDAHVDYARERWRYFQKKDVNEKYIADLRKKAVNSRKATLYLSRVRACVRRPALGQHLAYLQQMENVHMSADSSGEEEDTHRRVYRFTPPAWQSKDLQIFFAYLDEWSRQDWINPSGKRRTSGNPPRVRVRSKKVNDPLTVAPRGLPRNFYDAKWMEGLKPWQLVELDPQEEFDLSLPDHMETEL